MAIPLRIFDSNIPGQVLSPSVVNTYSALAVPAWYRAVNFLASNLASFPRSVHRDGAKVRHPLDTLLKRRPNGYQNATTLWKTWFFHAAHAGNGYLEIERQGSRPAALHNLKPEDVVPFRYDDGSGIQQWFYYKPAKRAIPAADVLHLAASLSHDGIAGMDPVDLHRPTLQRATTLMRFELKFLERGTVVRGAIEIPENASDEKVAEIVNVVRAFRGADADKDVMVLTGGARLSNSTLSPRDSQLAEQGASVIKEISRILNVPPQFLYEFSESKYNNSIEQMGQDVVRYTFRPLIELVEDELGLKLLTEAEQDAGHTVKLNPGALLRGDTQTQTTTVVASVNGGIRTKNEGRALLDLPRDPDPESDKLKTLGDTNPPGPGRTEPGRTTSSAARARAAYAALAPVIEAACARVDTKADKAFETHGKKAGQERTLWANVFAETQRTYAAEALKPVADALAALDAGPIDVARVAERYAAAVRRRAATGETKSLADIVNESTDPEPAQ